MTRREPDLGKAALGCGVLIAAVVIGWVTVLGLVILTRAVL